MNMDCLFAEIVIGIVVIAVIVLLAVNLKV